MRWPPSPTPLATADYREQRKRCSVLLVKPNCLRKLKNVTFRVEPSGSESDPVFDFKRPQNLCTWNIILMP